MRLLVVAALLVLSCAPSPDERGGYLNGVCQPTTRRDGQGVATSTGKFGLVGSTSVTVDDEVFVVWRNGGPSIPLVVSGYPLPSPASWVRWPVGGYASASPWGDVGYRVGLKPIGRPGCWRIVPEGGQMEDGIVIQLRASP
jgi:hypothetical protein